VAPGLSEQELGEYRLVRRIAVGGMAEIFEARREGTEQTVVLKVLLPQYAADPEFIAMLEDEARLAATLDHPNLVRVHELGRQGETRFMVMEHVQGPPLSRLLARCSRGAGSPPPPPVVLEIGRQLLEGLAYLHALTDEAGRPLEVVHRDVTPGNVLISSEQGLIKLTDFGIARHRLRQVRTRTGVIKGTVQYMAPEQVAGDPKCIDARADLYCAGLILFELLTGRPYIHAEREVELLRVAENPRWTAPTSVRPELDPALDGLLRPALQRFPEERYPAAASFAEALARLAEPAEEGPALLRGWLGELEQVSEAAATAATMVADSAPAGIPAGPAGTLPPATAPGTGRGRLGLLALGLLLVAAAGGAVWLALRPSDGPTAGETRVADGALADSAVVAGAPAARDAAAAVPSSTASDLGRPDLPPSRPDAREARRPLRRPATARKPRPRVKPKPRADARPAITPDPIAPLRARLERALKQLRARGIMVGDLEPALRAQLSKLRQQLRGGDPGDAGDAEASLRSLEPALQAVRVDRALVEAKLKRVHALLRRRKGAAVQRLRDRASQALQEFMDGRYDSANRQLNRILAAPR
jgi:serine/threonine-protein kinase